MIRTPRRRPSHLSRTAFLGATAAALSTRPQRARAQTARTAIAVAPILSTDMVALYYGVQQGIFERAGLDVTVQPAATGAAAMTAVVGGAVNIGYTNTLALTIARAKGIPVLLLSPGAQYNTNVPHAVLIVAADATLKTAKDLEGRTVAVAGLHDLLGVSVVAWLEKAGIDSGKVKFVELTLGTMLSALQSKRVDAAVSYEPFLSAATGSGAAKVFAKPYDAIGPAFLTGAWFALEPWIAQHRDAVLRFAALLGQTAQYADNHYDELVPLIASYSKLPPETLRKMVKVNVPPTLTAAMLQPVIETAAKYREIPASFRAQEMILPGVP